MRKPADDPTVPPEKDRAAAELGRRGGLKGGAVRASRMTPEERTESARMAAAARWARAAAPGEGNRDRHPDGEPFRFILLPAEIAQITGAEIVGSGGLQSLLRKLYAQLELGDTVEFDNAGFGQLVRYMTRIGGGGFETRLRRAFARSFLDLFTPIFEAERRS
jgi:hypothetical protein